MLAERRPFVIPPPTPANTGTSEASMIASVMVGCGVKG